MLQGVMGIASILLLVPILPPKPVFGVDHYYDESGQKIQRGKVSILHFFLHQIVLLIQEIMVGVAVSLGLRGSVTILIFLIVGADLYFKQGLSTQGLVITIIGVIALYLDQLVQNASELDFLKGTFHYKIK